MPRQGGTIDLAVLRANATLPFAKGLRPLGRDAGALKFAARLHPARNVPSSARGADGGSALSNFNVRKQQIPCALVLLPPRLRIGSPFKSRCSGCDQGTHLICSLLRRSNTNGTAFEHPFLNCGARDDIRTAGWAGDNAFRRPSIGSYGRNGQT